MKTHHSTLPDGWQDAGFKGESAPDLRRSGAFNVTTQPADGASYLGMVVRDNNTWECIYQNLAQPLKKERSYNLSIALAKSNVYLSISRLTDMPANYNTPIILRIWGGSKGEKLELLAISAPIHHSDWRDYNFRLTPNQDFDQLFLEAYYSISITSPFNRNILIDDLRIEVNQ